MDRNASLIRKIYVRTVGSVLARVAGKVAAARWMGVGIGNDCRLYTLDFGSEPFLVSIGDRVTVTAGCKFVTHDGSTCLVRDEAGRRYQHFAPIVVGNDVFIGVNTVVLAGVTVGSRVVIGAGSLVLRDVPDDSVVAGNPARFICSYSEFDRKVRTAFVCDAELDSARSYRERVELAIALEARRRVVASSEDGTGSD